MSERAIGVTSLFLLSLSIQFIFCPRKFGMYYVLFHLSFFCDFFFFRENRVFVDWLSSGIDGQCFVDFLVFSPSINSFTSFFVFFFVFVFFFFLLVWC